MHNFYLSTNGTNINRGGGGGGGGDLQALHDLILDLHFSINFTS